MPRNYLHEVLNGPAKHRTPYAVMHAALLDFAPYPIIGGTLPEEFDISPAVEKELEEASAAATRLAELSAEDWEDIERVALAREQKKYERAVLEQKQCRDRSDPVYQQLAECKPPDILRPIYQRALAALFPREVYLPPNYPKGSWRTFKQFLALDRAKKALDAYQAECAKVEEANTWLKAAKKYLRTLPGAPGKEGVENEEHEPPLRA